MGRVEQDGRAATLSPGDLAFYDSTRPYTLHFDNPFHQLVVQIPKRDLMLGDTRQLTARALGQGTAGGVVATFFTSLFGVARGSPEQFGVLLPHAVGLLSAAASFASRAEPGPDAAEALARERVLDFLRRNLANPRLDAAAVAKACHASRRTLYRMIVERSVFGEGDGSDLQVHDTALGRVGGLNCWEHLQPLTKYAMYSQGEEIHVGAWPSFSIYRGAARALGPEVNTAASLMYAVEGQTFVVAPCAVVGEAALEQFCDTDVKRQLLQPGGGFARIYGPEGSQLAEPLPETGEGILYADLDPDLIGIAKSAADPVGHYSRPDVLRLLVNRNPAPPVVEAPPAEQQAAADFPPTMTPA
jgi:Carbon-nitrogen hydrolase/AraC-binding-like domain